MASTATRVTSDPYHILLILFEYPVGTPQTIRWANIMRYVIEAGHRLTILSAEFAHSDRPIDHSLAALLHHPAVTLVQVPAERRNYGTLESLRWAQRAYDQALKVANMTAFDVVISSALPIADHLIASRLRGRGAVPLWIADYGDPWSTSRTLVHSAWRKPLYMAIERQIMRHADAITITTETARDAFDPIYNKPERVRVIPMAASYFHVTMNGMRDETSARAADPLRVLYTGSFYPARRPDKLFEALANSEGVHLTIVGSHFIDMREYLERWQISERVTLQDYANQQQIAQMQHEYDVLLLTSWPVPEQISGKFYEYIATDRPILYVTDHERDIASDYIRQHDRGYIVGNTPQQIAEALAQIRDEARAGHLKSHEPDCDAGFDRRAADLMALIGDLQQSE